MTWAASCEMSTGCLNLIPLTLFLNDLPNRLLSRCKDATLCLADFTLTTFNWLKILSISFRSRTRNTLPKFLESLLSHCSFGCGAQPLFFRPIASVSNSLHVFSFRGKHPAAPLRK